MKPYVLIGKCRNEHLGVRIYASSLYCSLNFTTLWTNWKPAIWTTTLVGTIWIQYDENIDKGLEENSSRVITLPSLHSEWVTHAERLSRFLGLPFFWARPAPTPISVQCKLRAQVQMQWEREEGDGDDRRTFRVWLFSRTFFEKKISFAWSTKWSLFVNFFRDVCNFSRRI